MDVNSSNPPLLFIQNYPPNPLSDHGLKRYPSFSSSKLIVYICGYWLVYWSDFGDLCRDNDEKCQIYYFKRVW